MTVVVEIPVRFRTCRRGEKPVPPAAPAPDVISAIARRIALAHQINAWITAGLLRDHADAARRFGLTRARLSQLHSLTLLALAVQEHVLLGHAVPTDRQLREVGRHPLWSDQLRAFHDLFPNLPKETDSDDRS